MSVVFLASKKEALLDSLKWAYLAAASKNLNLLVLVTYVGKTDEDALTKISDILVSLATDTQLNKPTESESKPVVQLRVCQPVAVDILSEAAAENAELFIIPKLDTARSNELTQELFLKCPCDTLVLRPATLDTFDKLSVLVPTSGGPHAEAAISLAESISDSLQGETTALYIEPEIGELAKAVGEKILKGILKKRAEGSTVKGKVIVASSAREGISTEAAEGYQLMIVGASNVSGLRSAMFGTVPDKLISDKSNLSIAVLRKALPISDQVKDRFSEWIGLKVPQLDRDSRISLFHSLQANSDWNFDFVALIILSTAIAAFGLIQSSTAVVIGAMLVAPLMTPLLASGLALSQANFRLIRDSTKSLIFGFITAVIVAFLVAMLSGASEITAEIAARGKPGMLDMAIAFLSGIAAAHCSARPNLSAALPGVAIAAALVPPIAATGIALYVGDFEVAQGAALLFGTNVVAIIIASSLTFSAAGVSVQNASSTASAWASRTLVALVISSLALFIPLGSFVIATVSDPNKTETNQELCNFVTSSFAAQGFRCHSLKRSSDSEGQAHVALKLESSELVSQLEIDKVAEILLSKLDSKVSLNAEVVIVRRSIASLKK